MYFFWSIPHYSCIHGIDLMAQKPPYHGLNVVLLASRWGREWPMSGPSPTAGGLPPSPPPPPSPLPTEMYSLIQTKPSNHYTVHHPSSTSRSAMTSTLAADAEGKNYSHDTPSWKNSVIKENPKNALQRLPGIKDLLLINVQSAFISLLESLRIVE